MRPGEVRTIAALGLAVCLFTGQGALAQTPDKEKPATDVNAKPKIAADIKPEALWDGRKMAPFKTLDYPKMVASSEADFLGDDDYVLGITVAGEPRAYPTRFIWWHHAINDKVTDAKTGKETFFAVTYCSVCNTGIGYDLMVNGKPVLLDFYGLYNGVVALCDRETGSALPQVLGRFVTGPLLDTELKPLMVLDTTWARWKKLHPNSLVMSPDTPYKNRYSPRERPELRGYPAFPAPFFRPTVTRGDKRLPPFDKILGVLLSPKGAKDDKAVVRRAYPMKTLQEAGGIVNDLIQETPVVVLLEPDTQTANAFSRLLDGKTLTFEARKADDGKVTFVDKETGTRWSLEGQGEEGALAGKSLARIENHLSQWYGWVAFFPETSIYGRTDPPQPGDPFEKPAAPPANPPK